MKHWMNAVLGLGLALTLAHGANADRPTPVAVAEIDYLLGYLGQSGCDFNRNGAWYDSGAAKAHLRYKYDALVKHDQIGTADDFIDKAATKSSFSGRAYKVRCAEGQEVSSGSWLHEALARYRLRNANDAAAATRPSS